MLKQFKIIMLSTLIIIICTAGDFYPQNGVLRSYYSKKKLESEISYVDDVLDGTSIWYYENGNIKNQITYTQGKLNGWVKSYYENGLPESEYFVDEGVLDGIASYYYENGALKEVLYYQMGQLTKFQKLSYDSNYRAPLDAFTGTSVRMANGGNPYELLCDVKICAQPLGGMEEIQKKIVYPQYAKLYGLEGIVTLIAKVDELGNVIETTIAKSLGLGCDEEAQRAVEQTRFIPGQDESGVVVSSVSIQVVFKLDENEDNINAANADKNLPGEDLSINNETSAAKGECGFEVCPEPVGGIDAIINNIRIPDDLVDADLTGTTVIRAEIDRFGNVIGTLIIDGKNYKYNEAVETAVKETRFLPAADKGIRLPAITTIKISAN